MRVSNIDDEKLNKIFTKKVITRADITYMIYNKSKYIGLTLTQVDRFLLLFFDLIFFLLTNKKEIQLRGFGTFSYTRLAATTKKTYVSNINYKKKKLIITKVPERATVRFKPSKTRIIGLREFEINNEE